MSKSQCHHAQLRVRETSYQVAHLLPDSSHELGHAAPMDARNVELLLDGAAEFGVGHSELLVDVGRKHLLERFLQALCHLPFDGSSSS